MAEGLARPWAVAVFNRAVETDKLEAWSERLLVLELAVSSPAWRRIQADGRHNPQQQAAILVEVLAELLDPEARNLLKLLGVYQRLDCLPQIKSQFQALQDRKAGVLELEVVSAFAPQADEAAFIAGLQRRFGEGLRLVRRTDPRLIGGLQIRQGDRVLDASLRGDLERAGRHLRI